MSKKILFVILPVLLLTSACVIRLNTGTATDSGFFSSYDRGENWEQKVEFLKVGEGRSFFKTIQSTFLKVDPNDPRAFYIGTTEHGLIYSFNDANGWQRALESKGVVHDLAIDFKDKCVLYAAVGNKLYKSVDCARHWKDIHLEGLPNQSINAVAVDAYNNNKIYIGTSGGGIFKSLDYGISWEAIKWFDNSIEKIMINPKNTAKVYVATIDKGIFKSNDEGMSWYNISDNIKDENDNKYDGVNQYRDMEFDFTQADALIYANSYGLFTTNNGGNSWEYIKLLTPPGSVNIYCVALNPNNNEEIYYSTATALYSSLDGGREWATKNLPTSKIPADIIVDIENGSNLFMTLRKN